MEWKTTSSILDDLRNDQDRGAWDRLVGRFRRPIVSFARQSGLSEADAEDVAQEALSAFAESYRRGDFDPARGRLSGWLFGIAYHQILRQRQKNARHAAKMATGAVGTTYWAEVPDERAATTIWDREWEQAVWRQCLDRVRGEFESTTFRAFEQSLLPDRRADEVAKLLGLPVKSVYNAKHRVLKRIREIRSEIEQCL